MMSRDDQQPVGPKGPSTPPPSSAQGQPPEHARLSEADARVMDALVEAGFEVGPLPGADQARASVATRLMGTLGQGPALDASGAGVERLLSAIRLAIRHNPRMGAADTRSTPLPATGWVADDGALSEADAEALQALVSNDYETRRVPGPLRARAEHQAALLALLGPTPTDARAASDAHADADQPIEFRREALIRRTMDAVQSREQSAARLVVEVPRTIRPRFRLADLVSIAAVLLLGGILLGPVITGYRQQSQRAACASNMATAGLAFGQYSGDFRESLPMASASLAGSPWWNVGRAPDQSNSANLYTLARTGYVQSLEPLACPGCENAPRGKPLAGTWDWTSIEQVSLSFQNLFAQQRPRWTQPGRMVMLADRSPITLSSLKREAQNPFANSPNHKGEGQWVLHNDGAACWSKSPMVTCGAATQGATPDNIWLPREIEFKMAAEDLARQIGKPVLLIGIEQPGTPSDIFLGP